MDIEAELKGKVGPFPLYVWLLIMTGAGLVAWLLLKKKNSSQTSGTPGTPCTMSDGSSGTWDSTGTVCQASTVSTVNAMSGTGGGRGWRGQSASPTTTATAAGSAAASTPATTGAVVPPSSNVITAPAGTGNPNSGNWTFPAPEPVKVTGAGKNSTQIKISWPAVKGPAGQVPAGYEVRIFRGGQVIRENSVPGTTYTESGLTKGTTGLVINVWANGGPLAPAHGTANT